MKSTYIYKTKPKNHQKPVLTGSGPRPDCLKISAPSAPKTCPTSSPGRRLYIYGSPMERLGRNRGILILQITVIGATT